MTGSWLVERSTGSAGAFHARLPPEPACRRVWVFRVTASALAMGSAQPLSDIDDISAERAGIEVIRRRSGGGAVLLQPDAVAWIDVIVPRGDPLWDDDVTRSSWWLGDTWSRVVRSFGLDARVHRGRLERAPWSERVCFAGLGSGEVSVDGQKVVGISQRRTRTQARFQCAALLQWKPEQLVGLLRLSEAERAQCLADVAGCAGGLVALSGPEQAASVAEVEERLLAELP
ncbi:MAG: lipoate---protein ligase [Acidimicrobiia bacterium]|nr:lipoate---protein ligase [Acidimicrobiia bacterium]